MILKSPLMLDTSFYETIPDFSKVSPRPLLVIPKATEGTGIVDPKFSTSWADLKQDGINRGTYHFFRKALNIAAQAALFIKTVKAGGVQTSDIFVLDVEETGVTATQIIAWLDAVEAEFGNLIMIYSRKNILDAITVTIAQATRLKKYPIWTAGYPTYPDNFIEPPAAYIPDPTKWGPVWAWQYSDKGTVTGITGAVDVNWMSTALIARLTPATPPADNSEVIAKLNTLLDNDVKLAASQLTMLQSHITFAEKQTIMDGKLDAILAKLNATPSEPPADDLGYTGPLLGEYTVIDDGNTVKWIGVLDSYGRDTSQMNADTAQWLQKYRSDDWKYFVNQGVFTKNENGLWFTKLRVYRGQKLRIALTGRSDNELMGRVIGFTIGGQGASVSVQKPQFNDWLFNKVQGQPVYFPQITPWRTPSDTVVNAVWVPMSWLEPVK